MADSETRLTTDHEEIRRWAEAHGGAPARARGTQADSTGMLRIDFPGGAGEESLEHIDWDDWFSTFEDRDLAFLHQTQKVSGEDSTFFELVNRSEAG